MSFKTKVALLLAALCLPAGSAAADSLRYDLGETRQNRATARPFRIGFTGLLGSVPQADDDDFAVIAPTELHLAWTVADFFAVGLGDLGFASADSGLGRRHAVSAGPFVEAFTFASERFQLFAQLGVPLQVRFSGGEGNSLGVAPRLAAGSRFWITDFFTLGFETRLALVATDHFLVEERVLPQGALPWTAGLNLDFHF